MISIENVKLHEKLLAINNKIPKINNEPFKHDFHGSNYAIRFQEKKIMDQNLKIYDKIHHM